MNHDLAFAADSEQVKIGKGVEDLQKTFNKFENFLLKKDLIEPNQISLKIKECEKGAYIDLLKDMEENKIREVMKITNEMNSNNECTRGGGCQR